MGTTLGVLPLYGSLRQDRHDLGTAEPVVIVLIRDSGAVIATLDWDVEAEGGPLPVMHFDVAGVDDDFEYEGRDGDDFIYRRMS